MAGRTPETVIHEVARVAKETLAEHYGNRVIFDPVVVIPKTDMDGDEYLHIYSVYEGSRDVLDIKWTIGFTGLMMPKLRDLGVDTIPNTSFVPANQWPSLEQVLSRRTS